jgi:uncharacterized protein (DUF736 family)
MAIIGTFNGSIEKGFEGKIETIFINADIAIERIARRSDKAPDFRVYHVTETFRSDIGAGWIEESEDRATKYVSLGIDDPGFPAKVYCRLVKSGAEHGFTLYWDRPKKTKHDDRAKAA